MKRFILVSFILLFLLNFVTKGVFAQNRHYACPLKIDDITGVMQWNDGWPFNVYGRQSHNNDAYEVVDVNGYFGSIIFAPADGEVININSEDTTLSIGRQVNIRGDDNIIYSIAHIVSPEVTLDQRVIGGVTSLGRLVNKIEAIPCDLTQNFTSVECIKSHMHFARYEGTFDNPSMGRTLEFISTYCGLNRPSDNNPEFPQLPTINCSKITGNPNINRCFSERPSETFHLSKGWNNMKVNQQKGQVSGRCIAVLKTNGRFIDVVSLADKTGSEVFMKCPSFVGW